MDDEALFARAGDAVLPSVYTRGPWDPGLLHGGPVAALLADACEGIGDPSFQPVRLTVDLLKPVPLQELSLEAAVVRTGRRLQLLEAALRFGGSLVARASMLALRPMPFEAAGLNPPLVPPEDAPDDASDLWRFDPHSPAFIGGGMDFRFVREVTTGTAIAWLRLRRPLFDDGPEPSPLVRAAAAADVGGAVSARRGAGLADVSFVNADISVHLSRPLEGEWVRLESTSRWEASGIGAVSAEMGDRLGAVGRVDQALVLEAQGRLP